MYYKNILGISVSVMVLILGAILPGNAEAGVRYKKATEAGQQYCGKRFPANKKYAKSQWNVLKGGCWSCPKGFKRTALPAPDEHKSCKKPRPYTDAKFHSNATGILNNICKGKPWLKDKKCWTCPSGYKRSLKVVGGKPQCKPKTKSFYHPATNRGDPGCGPGLWSPSLSGKCFSCPAGYFRNPLRTSLDRSKDPKACMTYVKSKKAQAGFINSRKREAERRLNAHPDLVKQAGTFQRKISQTVKQRGGIKNLSKADIREAGGVQLLAAACDKEYGSVTITGGGDASYIGGGNASGGFAIGLVEECDARGNQDGNDWIDQNTDFAMMWLVTVNASGGASVGLDAGINIGFWKFPYNKLHGFAQGVVLGGGIAATGVNGSAWWAINWGGNKDEFAGISLGWQGGASAEIEYNWGYTFQKGTFNHCKDVRIEATNNTGKKIKVIDVDYHDYAKNLWRSKPTKNTKVPDGSIYRRTASLHQVGNAKTQIRIKYRVKDGLGWSDVRRAWSKSSVCTEGKTYTVSLKKK